MNISNYTFDYNCYKVKTHEYLLLLHSDVIDTQLSDTWIN
jgi:hypothetical protein